jgi:surface polysaccharide O-acyltransferase-like enzyme
MNSKNESKRYNNYDLLRILATIAVIVIHVNYQYFAYRAYTPQLDKYYVIESMFNIVMRFSVPAFVMISGAFLLHDHNNGNIKKFYCKTSYKIFLPTVIIIFLFLLVDLIKQAFGEQSYWTTIKSVLEGSFYNLWFMYMLAGLYLLTPFIVKLKDVLSFRAFEGFTYMLLIWAVISQATTSYTNPYSLGVVIAYLSYFMMGNLIFEKINIQGKKGIPAGGWFLFSCLMFLATFIIRYKGYDKYLFDAYTNFFSPTIVLASIGVFCGFSKLKIKRDYSKLSSFMFYVYLFHTIIYLKAFNITKILFLNEIFAIGEVVIITFVVGTLCGVIYEWLWKLLEHRFHIKEGYRNLKLWK